jgi:hypothetical protein
VEQFKKPDIKNPNIFTVGARTAERSAALKRKAALSHTAALSRTATSSRDTLSSLQAQTSQ